MTASSMRIGHSTYMQRMRVASCLRISYVLYRYIPNMYYKREWNNNIIKRRRWLSGGKRNGRMKR